MLKLHKYPAVTHPFSPLGIKKKKEKEKRTQSQHAQAKQDSS